MPCPFREKTANQWLKDLLKVPQARNGSKPQLHASKARSFSMLSNWGVRGVTRRKRSRFQWLIWASAKSKGHCYLPWNPHSWAHEISLLFFYNMVAKCQQRYFSVSQVTITMLGSEWNWTNSKYPWVFNVVKTILKKQELAIFGDLSTLSLLNPDLKQNSLNSKPMCVALGNTFKLAGSPSVHLHMGRGVRGGGPAISGSDYQPV